MSIILSTPVFLCKCKTAYRVGKKKKLQKVSKNTGLLYGGIAKNNLGYVFLKQTMANKKKTFVSLKKEKE